MTTHTQEFTRTDQTNHVIQVLKALVIGGLVGAGTMLFFAPQSGRKTRAEVQKKALDLRDRTTDTVKDAVSQMRSKGHQITDDVREKAEDLQHQGVDVLAEQLERIATAAEAGKKTLERARKK